MIVDLHHVSINVTDAARSTELAVDDIEAAIATVHHHGVSVPDAN